jgi:tetratricopeptide (TPR) repeat protein
VATEGSGPIEPLPGELEPALRSALRPGEALLLAVPGNPNEALAVTRQRLLLLKAPAISGSEPVQVREAPLAGIANVRLEDQGFGGRVAWDSARPGAPTFVEYAAYDSSRYARIAEWLQAMIGQPRNPIPSSPSVQPRAEPLGGACPKCATAIPAGGSWCPSCGLLAYSPCWECGEPLAAGTAFCARCGTPNTEPAVVQCPECSAVVTRGTVYCTACGAQARPACAECGQPMRQEWKHCPDCGGEPAWEGNEAPEPGTVSVAGATLQRAAPQSREAAPLNDLAVRAYEQGDYAEAARLFRQAIDAEPNDASYWTNLGVACGQLGDDQQALESYRRAIEINPNEVSAYLYLGELYLERDRPTEAREMWERLIRIAPDSPDADEARQNLKSLEEV